MSYNRITEYVDEREVVELTQNLVRIPSVFNPDVLGANEEKVARYIEDYLRNLGLSVFYEEVVPGRPNIIAVYDSGRPGKTILFEGHTDVVTAGDLTSWSYDPFGAVIEHGRIYGRGSCDTKGNLAAAISAVHGVLRSGGLPRGKIVLCIPCDEEGMMIGIKEFIRRGWAKGIDGAVICEPEDNQICVSQKGAMRAVVRTFGKMAHGAMPLTGINPNTRMARIIVALDELEAAEKSRLGEHAQLGWPSITPTIVRGPVMGEPQINVVPEECMMTLDIRTVPGQKHEKLKEQMDSILESLASKDKHFKAELKVIEERPWTQTDMKDPIVNAISESYHSLTGKDPIYNGVPGATDGTFLHMAGIPIVTTGAGDRYIPHHIDEYVEVNQLVEAARLYAETAKIFLD